MISKFYIFGYDKVEKNGKTYHHPPVKVYGNEPWEIEISEPDMTFEEMLNDSEMFIPHHLLEILYSKKELEEMNRYDNVNPDELIWMRESTHWSNPIIHKSYKTHTEEHSNKISKALKGNKACSRLGKPTTEFGRKYKEHYGLNAADNRSLYETEHSWYLRHNRKCSWE